MVNEEKSNISISNPTTITVRYNIDDVMSAVSTASEIDVALIRGKSRKEKVVNARQIFCFIAAKETGNMYARIAEEIEGDGFNESSVVYSIKTIQGFLDVNDTEIMNIVNAAYKELILISEQDDYKINLVVGINTIISSTILNDFNLELKLKKKDKV